jgi:hypothetical protein
VRVSEENGHLYFIIALKPFYSSNLHLSCFLVNSCSKEALKYSSCGSRRVNISAAVGEWPAMKKIKIKIGKHKVLVLKLTSLGTSLFFRNSRERIVKILGYL